MTENKNQVCDGGGKVRLKQRLSCREVGWNATMTSGVKLHDKAWGPLVG